MAASRGHSARRRARRQPTTQRPTPTRKPYAQVNPEDVDVPRVSAIARDATLGKSVRRPSLNDWILALFHKLIPYPGE
jgi:hypothetical protein